MLVVQADGTNVLEKRFQCGPGQGEWKKAVFQEQITYGRTCTTGITRPPSLRAQSGSRSAWPRADWVQVTEIGLKPAAPGAKEVLGNAEAGVRQSSRTRSGYTAGCRRRAADRRGDCATRPGCGRPISSPGRRPESPGHRRDGRGMGSPTTRRRTTCFLRWAEDCLGNWKQAGVGWALWNFRGPFGVLDSQRADVRYEPFEGHQLDRKLLDLLQKY